nr:porin family protein [uncultured Flavobacterium sp.]
MKKGLLILAAMFTFGYAANAQDTAASNAGTNAGMVRFGPKAGLNFTNFTGDGDSDGKTGFYIGGFVDLAVTDKFHVQPELMYSAEGADDAGIDYIRIPVMAKFYVTEGFNLLAGPEVAFKVATEDDFMDEATKSTDFGLGLGAAYDLPMGLIIEMRYNLGLTDISEIDNFEIKNTGLQLGLGYKF